MIGGRAGGWTMLGRAGMGMFARAEMGGASFCWEWYRGDEGSVGLFLGSGRQCAGGAP